MKIDYRPKDGLLLGLVFYNGEDEIASIGFNDTKYATTMIKLAEGEILCGISSSRDNGLM